MLISGELDDVDVFWDAVTRTEFEDKARKVIINNYEGDPFFLNELDNNKKNILMIDLNFARNRSTRNRSAKNKATLF
jgi:hypothetical protein